MNNQPKGEMMDDGKKNGTTKRTIEFLASVEIEVANPDDMDTATRTARRILERAGASGPGMQVIIGHVVEMTREQCRAVRAATLVAENGGSVPGTMDEVAEGEKAILGASEGQERVSWFVADSTR